jgi:NAD-dependent SIR2 family protein deacetylase
MLAKYLFERNQTVKVHTNLDLALHVRPTVTATTTLLKTLMLTTDIQVGTPPSSTVEDVIRAICHAKAIVVICGNIMFCLLLNIRSHYQGAGISVEAGIPTFRGKNGIFKDTFGGRRPEELFQLRSSQVRARVRCSSIHIHITQQDSNMIPAFCTFMAEMAKKAAGAQPTHFHELLGTLNTRRTLLRVYTQNIDGLELKSGLSQCSAYGVHGGKAICVPLHGNIHQMRCLSCSSTFTTDAHIHILSNGQLPSCATCDASRTARAQLNLRDRKNISLLKPDIILYGEYHPLAEEIASIQKHDIGCIDLLLVVGTSMKVDGIQQMIRTFSQTLQRKHGKKRAPFLSSIYVNMELCSPQKASDLFDCWVAGDCQLFATITQAGVHQELIKRGEMPQNPWQTLDDDDKGAEMIRRQRLAVANRRLDLRPLSRYY